MSFENLNRVAMRCLIHKCVALGFHTHAHICIFVCDMLMHLHLTYTMYSASRKFQASARLGGCRGRIIQLRWIHDAHVSHCINVMGNARHVLLPAPPPTCPPRVLFVHFAARSHRERYWALSLFTVLQYVGEFVDLLVRIVPSIWQTCEFHGFVWPSNIRIALPLLKTTPLHVYDGRFRVVCPIRINILFVLRSARYRRLICQQKRMTSLLGRNTKDFVNWDCPLHGPSLQLDSIAKYSARWQHSKFWSVKMTKLCLLLLVCHLQIVHGACIGFWHWSALALGCPRAALTVASLS
jgi:hypothetical protein